MKRPSLPARSIATVGALIITGSVLRCASSAAGFQTASPASQQPQGPPVRVSVEVVNVYAVVRDKKRLVPDLTKDDFELTEDGVPQQIRYFSRQTDTPLTLVLAVDTSPSQIHVLPLEQEQAKTFVQDVLRPKDLFAVLHFDLEVELLQDFTRDAKRLARAIDETHINGGAVGPLPATFPTTGACCTKLYDAVYLASNQMLKNEVGRKVLVLLTDGVDEGSQESEHAALEAADKANVIVYSIDIGEPAFYLNSGFDATASGAAVLRKLSDETGGRVVTAHNPRQTAAAFQEIAAELRSQYLLGYTLRNSRHDGAWRRIQVRVRHGGYKVQARRGYYAPST